MSFTKYYLIADTEMYNIFRRFEDLQKAKEALVLFRKMYPELHIVIFERVSETTWEGRYAKYEIELEV